MYYFMKCGDTTKNVPFRVIVEGEFFIELELISYPSCYGMSKPYRECAHKQDLTQPKTAEQIIKWVENNKDFKDTASLAAKGNPWAVKIISEWKEVKRRL